MCSSDLDALFRSAGKAPELWDSATGSITRPGVFRGEKDGRTALPMHLDPNGSVFVVFREKAPVRHATETDLTAGTVLLKKDGRLLAALERGVSASVRFSDGASAKIKASELPPPVTLDGPWQVTFPPNLGAPASATFDTLLSWPDHPDAGIRFFSGTATYTQTFELPSALFGEGRELTLDLGRVEVIAQVTLNGRSLGTLWKPPFRVRADGVAKPGANTLSVRITSLWPNRLIGDAALPDDIPWQSPEKAVSLPASWPEWLIKGQPRPSGRIAFCTRKNVYGKTDPLLPSGLLGPVTFSAAQQISVE